MRLIHRLGACLFVITFVSINILFAQKSIVGKWTGTDSEGQKNNIIFTRDGHMNPELDPAKMKFQKFLVRYSVNYEADPIWLDLIRCDLNGRAIDTGKTIIKFLNDTTLVWRVNPDKKGRPKSFEEGDKRFIITLYKIE